MCEVDWIIENVQIFTSGLDTSCFFLNYSFFTWRNWLRRVLTNIRRGCNMCVPWDNPLIPLQAIGPHDVLATLLNNLKVQERQLRVCTTGEHQRGLIFDLCESVASRSWKCGDRNIEFLCCSDASTLGWGGAFDKSSFANSNYSNTIQSIDAYQFAVAIAIVSETCAPFTVLPAIMNEYRVPEMNVQNGVLKALSFMFEVRAEEMRWSKGERGFMGNTIGVVIDTVDSYSMHKKRCEICVAWLA